MEQEEMVARKKKHALGYERQSQTDEEIGEREAEQVWCEYEPEETK